MWQTLHASFWKFSKLSNSGIFLNWSITDEVTTRDTTAYFFGSLCTVCRYMVTFGAVTRDFTTLERVQQASIISGVSLTTLARVVLLGTAAISNRVCFTTIH